MSSSLSLSIEAYFDLICPWCLIGKRHLETALARFRQERPDVAVSVEWRSYPLMPATPPAGIPYRDFYVARLGSPGAVAARQAQVRAAASEAGLTLALDRIETFPNTLLGHRLIRFARQSGGPDAAAALIGNLFERYFIRAENIGDPLVMRQAVAECRIRTPGPTDAPIGHDADWLPSLHDADTPPHRPGMGVPHFVFNGTHSVSGARPPEALVEAMQRAVTRARQLATRAAA